ncbi:polyprenyl synthetase family protein [Streptomyces gulbargensis]|uniref:Polyprenyl synthetase family protein n=1 Tax=Streptomyces gulbargensis TaxID=364901 RepID=A0ABP7LCV7_9ACTN
MRVQDPLDPPVPSDPPEPAAPGGPGEAVGPAGPVNPVGTVDPVDVDRDVPAAVEAWLRETLERRVREASATDAVFGSDLAARVARFAVTGGSRLRAELLWWAARGCGGGESGAARLLGAAAAMELIQTCALIHDDVMDGSALRRGRAALHVVLDGQYGTGARELPCGTFGGAAAVLAGDLALAWADDAFVECLDGSGASGGAYAIWRAMRTEMVAGQYLDLRAQATGTGSAGQAARVAALKTASYTVERPLALGATLAGAPERTVRRLREAGRSAGLAFQLRDDLRGTFGDPAVIGKPVGEDLREGRATYVLAVARERCARAGDEAGLRLLDGAAGPAGAGGRAADRVLDLLVACGARDEVARRVGELCHRGAEAVREAGLAPAAEDRIVTLLRGACGPDGGASGSGSPQAVRKAGRPVPTGGGR